MKSFRLLCGHRHGTADVLTLLPVRRYEPIQSDRTGSTCSTGGGARVPPPKLLPVLSRTVQDYLDNWAESAEDEEAEAQRTGDGENSHLRVLDRYELSGDTDVGQVTVGLQLPLAVGYDAGGGVRLLPTRLLPVSLMPRTNAMAGCIDFSVPPGYDDNDYTLADLPLSTISLLTDADSANSWMWLIDGSGVRVRPPPLHPLGQAHAPVEEASVEPLLPSALSLQALGGSRSLGTFASASEGEYLSMLSLELASLTLSLEPVAPGLAAGFGVRIAPPRLRPLAAVALTELEHQPVQQGPTWTGGGARLPPPKLLPVLNRSMQDSLEAWMGPEEEEVLVTYGEAQRVGYDSDCHLLLLDRCAPSLLAVSDLVQVTLRMQTPPAGGCDGDYSVRLRPPRLLPVHLARPAPPPVYPAAGHVLPRMIGGIQLGADEDAQWKCWDQHNEQRRGQVASPHVVPRIGSRYAAGDDWRAQLDSMHLPKRTGTNQCVAPQLVASPTRQAAGTDLHPLWLTIPLRFLRWVRRGHDQRIRPEQRYLPNHPLQSLLSPEAPVDAWVQRPTLSKQRVSSKRIAERQATGLLATQGAAKATDDKQAISLVSDAAPRGPKRIAPMIVASPLPSMVATSCKRIPLEPNAQKEPLSAMRTRLASVQPRVDTGRVQQAGASRPLPQCPHSDRRADDVPRALRPRRAPSTRSDRLTDGLRHQEDRAAPVLSRSGRDLLKTHHAPLREAPQMPPACSSPPSTSQDSAIIRSKGRPSALQQCAPPASPQHHPSASSVAQAASVTQAAPDGAGPDDPSGSKGLIPTTDSGPNRANGPDRAARPSSAIKRPRTAKPTRSPLEQDADGSTADLLLHVIREESELTQGFDGGGGLSVNPLGLIQRPIMLADVVKVNSSIHHWAKRSHDRITVQAE